MKIITKLEDIPELSDEELKVLKPVVDKFGFFATEYYLKLIDWKDPDDPIRRLVIPSIEELDGNGSLDPSNEAGNQVYLDGEVIRGVQHKYPDTILIKAAEICAAECRYCFRKRLFGSDNDKNDFDNGLDFDAAVEYIEQHPEIQNVLLTGGDPLMLSTSKLEDMIQAVHGIDHVESIRIGSKIPAFYPHKITEKPKDPNNPGLPEMLSKYAKDKGLYLMAHFDHPRELTDDSIEAIRMLKEAGVTIYNQCPITRGVNDDPKVLNQLFRELSRNGVVPYYQFICRPTSGNEAYTVPIEEAYDIFNEARAQCPGIAQTAKLAMSHADGKIEIVGMDDHNIYMRFHRARNPADQGKFMIFARDPTAKWFDDYLVQKPTSESFK